MVKGEKIVNEKLEKFLLYGIENKIKRKEIYEMDAVLLFLSIFMFILSEDFKKVQIIYAIFIGVFIVVTFSVKDVIGRRIFLIYGTWSLSFSIVFGVLGSVLMLSTIESRYHLEYIVVLLGLYLIMLLIFILIIIYLIKRNAYASVPMKKMATRWVFLLFGICGISVAKILSSNLGEEKMVQIGAICFYLISFILILGYFNFVKYILLKKYNM